MCTSNIEIFSNSWDSNLKKLDTVLDILQENIFIVNSRKSEWAVKETDWLGYRLTPTVAKPWTKKVNAILKIKPPSNATELGTLCKNGYILQRYMTSWITQEGKVGLDWEIEFSF